MEEKLLERVKDSISTFVFLLFFFTFTVGELYSVERPWVNSDTGLVEVSFASYCVAMIRDYVYGIMLCSTLPVERNNKHSSFMGTVSDP